MTLRDEYGEVEVGIGDLFEHESATLAVVCPEPDYFDVLGNPVLCVRLKQGFIVKNGQRFEALAADGNYSPAGFPIQPLFHFTGELVASCVRAHRLMNADILAASVSQHPAQSVAKTPRARTSKKDARKSQPTSESLFD